MKSEYNDKPLIFFEIAACVDNYSRRDGFKTHLYDDIKVGFVYASLTSLKNSSEFIDGLSCSPRVRTETVFSAASLSPTIKA